MAARWLVIGVTTAACGRVGFESRVDAGFDAIDAPALVPGLVAMTGMTGPNGTTLQIPIADVIAGDLLIVAVAVHGNATVASVVDGAGTPLTSAGARAVMGNTASELWYETNSATTNAVTVTMGQAGSFDVWVAEFSGTKPGPPATTAMSCLQYPPTFVTAPVTTTVADELVVSVTMFAAPVFVSGIDPPFNAFPPLTGNDAAFYVAPTPSTYATTGWIIAAGTGMASMTCASSAVWPPGR